MNCTGYRHLIPTVSNPSNYSLFTDVGLQHTRPPTNTSIVPAGADSGTGSVPACPTSSCPTAPSVPAGYLRVHATSGPLWLPCSTAGGGVPPPPLLKETPGGDQRWANTNKVRWCREGQGAPQSARPSVGMAKNWLFWRQAIPTGTTCLPLPPKAGVCREVLHLRANKEELNLLCF